MIKFENREAAVFMGAACWDEENEEYLLYVYDCRDRVFNAPADVPMMYYVEQRDTWRLQASAASHLNEALGVLSVTERGIAYGDPQTRDAEDLFAWIDITAGIKFRCILSIFCFYFSVF